MSKIKLPHASGNSMSIGAPATNPASDLELKLPATIGTANQVLRNSSTPGTLEFASPGKVLNIYYNSSETISQTPDGDWGAGPATLTITPVSSSSKFLVQSHGSGSASSNNEISFILRRGGSAITGSTSSHGTVGMNSIVTGSLGQSAVSGWQGLNFSFSYLDSPATASSITYDVIAKQNSGQFRWNRSTNTSGADSWASLHSLTIFEVAG